MLKINGQELSFRELTLDDLSEILDYVKADTIKTAYKAAKGLDSAEREELVAIAMSSARDIGFMGKEMRGYITSPAGISHICRIATGSENITETSIVDVLSSDSKEEFLAQFSRVLPQIGDKSKNKSFTKPPKKRGK